MADVEQHLLEKEQGQVDAFNRGDLDAVLAYFDPQVVGFSSTRHERIEGLEAMRETFEYYLKAAEKVEYSISEPAVRVYDDTAIVTFYWEVKLTSGGKTQTVHGRGTHVFVHKSDDWKIVHEHFSRAHHS
ncbi:MAG: nuclear transport factor 2 family protein [Calditrichaeota bacterium]|nr:nuclear transport factor 2 family protein [Calditrichota bacterium]